MRQRRRAERGRLGTRVSEGQNRRTSERIQQRYLIWGAAAVGILLVLLLSVGWAVTSYFPARQTVATVDDQTVRARHILSYTQLEASVTGFYQPARALNNYVRDIILRKEAGALGVEVSEDEVNQRLALLFDPDADEENPPTSLSATARRNFDTALGALGVGEQEFRVWIEGQLLQDALVEHFESQVPAEMEQVHVHWIIAEDATKAQDASNRIQAGEEFAAVAADLNVEDVFADENGLVGWVPEGTWTELDPYLFGDEAKYAEVTGPLPAPLDDIVLWVSEGPSVQPVREEIREVRGLTAFQEWLNEQTEDRVDMVLTQANAAWIIEQLT